jgi:Ran GTPase-activating protein (RanGAP) involved in mRNA processing and transport
LAKYFDTLVEKQEIGITSLWIEVNRLDDTGICILLDSLKNYHHLERLSIGSNGMSSVGAYKVYQTFKNHPTLKILGLGCYKSTADMGEISNKIGDEGAVYIAQLIQENKTLQYIDIIQNGITNAGICVLTQALHKNDTLLYLHCSQYGLKMEQKYITEINKKLEENREKSGLDTKQVMFERFIKHSLDIRNIDSIYRNNM